MTIDGKDAVGLPGQDVGIGAIIVKGAQVTRENIWHAANHASAAIGKQRREDAIVAGEDCQIGEALGQHDAIVDVAGGILDADNAVAMPRGDGFDQLPGEADAAHLGNVVEQNVDLCRRFGALDQGVVPAGDAGL
jgi:hypothetical protein